MYVTLEPCSRPGRVGACCDALIAAGVKKVVWACYDPNPKNAGRAARVLRAAGIETECWQKSREAGKRALAAEALGLIAPFAKHVTSGLPYVTVKIAMSLDGRICDDTGDAKWISSEPARHLTGSVRGLADAVMVGAQTLRSDNPSLLSRGRRNDSLFRIIVTRSGNLPVDAQVFTDSARDRTLVLRVGGKGGDCADSPQAEMLEASDLRAAMKLLAARGFMHILCEGGLNLARSLAAAGLVDEWITVLAPKVIGSGRVSDAVEIAQTACICDFIDHGNCSPSLPGAIRHIRRG